MTFWKMVAAYLTGWVIAQGTLRKLWDLYHSDYMAENRAKQMREMAEMINVVYDERHHKHETGIDSDAVHFWLQKIGEARDIRPARDLSPLVLREAIHRATRAYEPLEEEEER